MWSLMRVLLVKRTIKTWSDKFKDLLFKSTNRFQISDIVIELIELNNTGLKKKVSEVFMFNINKRILVWFLIVRRDKTFGITSKGKRYVHFFRFEKQAKLFGSITMILAIQDIIPGKVLSWRTYDNSDEF